jgi:hypothetical protein
MVGKPGRAAGPGREPVRPGGATGAVPAPGLDRCSWAPAGGRRPHPGRVCDQAGLGCPDDRPRAGRRCPGGVGGRRRGLRRQPWAAGRAGSPPARLRVGGGLRPPGPGRRRHPAHRRPAGQGPGAGVAADLVWHWRQRPRYCDWAFLRLDHGPGPGERHGQHWLMVRRNQRTGELAFQRCWIPARCRWPSWSGSPGPGGRWKSASRPARACVAWTSTSSAAGAPGTAGSPWPCWPTPSWWWRP